MTDREFINYSDVVSAKLLYHSTSAQELKEQWGDLKISIEDLLKAKEAFERDAMYEHCQIIMELAIEACNDLDLVDFL